MADVELPGTVRIVDDVPRRVRAARRRAAPRVDCAVGWRARAPLATRRCARRDHRLVDVDVYFGDERVVPVDDPTTRTRAWPGGSCSTRCARVPIHSMSAGADRGRRAAVRRRSCARPADRHRAPRPRARRAHRVAVPGSPAVDEAERFVVEAGDDLHPHPRLTFTFPAIARARLVVVTVEGEEKRDPIRADPRRRGPSGRADPGGTGAVDRGPGRDGRRLGSPHAQRLVVPGAARRAARPS